MRALCRMAVVPLFFFPQASDGQQLAVEASGVGVFESAQCPVEIPGTIDGETVKCGWVEVPEFHDRPGDEHCGWPSPSFRRSARARAPTPW